MSKKKRDSEPDDPQQWSESAKSQFEQGEQMLRLMGLDDKTIGAMKKAMGQLYDPKTGEFQLDDFDKFKDAVLPSLIDSPVMEDTITSTAILNQPALRKFWFTREEMLPCLSDCETWLEGPWAEEEGRNLAKVLFEDSCPDERMELGDILYGHYIELITPQLEERIYDALFRLSQVKDKEVRKLAKDAMSSFDLFPGYANAILQFLFIKSFLLHCQFLEELETIASENEKDEFMTILEDAFFAVLCEGEDTTWSEVMEDFDEEDEEWEDEDEDWEDEEEEEGAKEDGEAEDGNDDGKKK